MSDHATTVRFGLPPLGSHTVLIREQQPLRDAYAALDALVTENEQLRSALLRISNWPFDVTQTADSDLRAIKDFALVCTAMDGTPNAEAAQ